MTNVDYIKARDDAAIAIQENGGPVEIWRISGEIDPVQGSAPEPVLVASGHAIQTNYSKQATDGERIKPGDKKLLMVVNGEIREEDQVRMGGVVWFIKSIDDLAPDGEFLILSKVQVRK